MKHILNTIFGVRLMTTMLKFSPYLLLLTTFCVFIDTSLSIKLGNYTEFQDELGNLLYIVYDNPNTQWLSKIFLTSYYLWAYLYVSSRVLKFCFYFRLPLYFVLFNLVFQDLSRYIIISETAYISFIGMSIFSIIGIFVSVYLHLLHLAKVKRNKANQAPK